MIDKYTHISLETNWVDTSHKHVSKLRPKFRPNNLQQVLSNHPLHVWWFDFKKIVHLIGNLKPSLEHDPRFHLFSLIDTNNDQQFCIGRAERITRVLFNRGRWCFLSKCPIRQWQSMTDYPQISGHNFIFQHWSIWDVYVFIVLSYNDDRSLKDIARLYKRYL